MYHEQQVDDVPLTEMKSCTCWENFSPIVWNRLVIEVSKHFRRKNHAAYLVYHQSWKQVCTSYCRWLSQRPVWSFSLGLNILLKAASGKNSLHISEWQYSTVAANVLWSKGWNIVLREIKESAKLGQIVTALSYSHVDWRDASSGWDLERIFGCIKWLLPRTTSL